MEYNFIFFTDLSFLKTKQSISIGFLYSLRDALVYFETKIKQEKIKSMMYQPRSHFLIINQQNISNKDIFNKDLLNILIEKCINSIRYLFNEDNSSNETIQDILHFRDNFSKIISFFEKYEKTKIIITANESNKDIIFDSLKDFPLGFDKSLTVSIKVLNSVYNTIEIED